MRLHAMLEKCTALVVITSNRLHIAFSSINGLGGAWSGGVSNTPMLTIVGVFLLVCVLLVYVCFLGVHCLFVGVGVCCFLVVFYFRVGVLLGVARLGASCDKPIQRGIQTLPDCVWGRPSW